MKNKKFIIVPILTFVLTFITLGILGVSYSATDSNGYYYIRRNMLSHHYIKNNTNNTASGTILVKTGSKSSNSTGTAAAVYCAEQGANNSGSAHTKKSLASVSTSKVSSNAKTKLNVMMQYSYPYITLSELKTYLKDSSIGISASDYSNYNFDNLDAQECLTATQAAIWNAIKNTTKFVYNKTVSSISSSQSSYKNFGRINWQTCAGYNTGSGTKKTILTSEEQEWYNTSQCNTNGEFYKNVYSVKKDGKTANRINTLINWYLGLSGKVSTTTPEASYSVKSSHYERVGDSLTLTVVIDSAGNDYNITFYDYSGNVVLPSQNVTGNPNGNEFIITGLSPTTGGVNAEIITKSSEKQVFYYDGSGQDWIGVDTTPSEYKVTLNILNEGTGQIAIYKVANSSVNVDVNYELTSIDNNKCGAGCLSGAHLVLYASDKKTIVDEVITTTSSITFTNLPDGKYYLYEEDPPYGYVTYNYNTKNVDSEGFIEINIQNGNMASVVINNSQTKICFTKVDELDNSKVVSGAKLRVEDAEGSTYEVFESSDQQGAYCISGQLNSGYYYVIEETAPANYVKNNKIYKVPVGKFNSEDIVEELEESENVVLLNPVNNNVNIPNRQGVVVTKSDLSNGRCVEGATLVIKDKDGKVIDEWISSCEDGKDSHQIGLDPGTYTLTETIAPKGYATAETIEFTINSAGKVDKSLDMKDAPIEVCLLKVSKDAVEPLIGAEFEIYNSDNTFHETIVTDIVEQCIEYMPVGEYFVKETKAPDGYKINEEEIKITVKDTSEKQIFEIENEVIAPKTSMDTSKIIILVATMFALFGLGLVFAYGIKKQG